MTDADTLVSHGLETALRLPSVVVVLLDTDQSIAYWNDAATRLTGWQASAVAGRNIAGLMPEGEHGTWRKLVIKLARGRQVPPMQTRLICAEDRHIDVLLSAAPVMTPESKVCGYALSLQDITRVNEEISRAQRSSAEVQSVVQTVLDGIIGISATGVIEAFNPAAERLFGYRAHEVIGRNVSMLMPEPYRSEHDGYLHRFVTTGKARIIGIGREVVAQRKDGSTFPADLSVSELKLTGEQRAFVGVVRDISERKEAELQLRTLNTELADKVREIGDTLARLRETQHQLVQAEKMASLGALVAGVAHEINTPIGVCVSASSLLEAASREVTEKLQAGSLTRSEFNRFIERANEATGLISRNIHRAADLVSAFKQTAVDRSNEATRKMDLQAYLHEIILSLTPVWKRAGHRIELDCPAELHLDTDAGALAQILTNLITNAVTHAFTPEHPGEIAVIAREADGRVELSVADNGRGIAAENLGRIFEPFFTTARATGGTGLGLHIAYNLVTQALDGSIHVESAVGRGTRFVIRFPSRLDKVRGGANDAQGATSTSVGPQAE